MKMHRHYFESMMKMRMRKISHCLGEKKKTNEFDLTPFSVVFVLCVVTVIFATSNINNDVTSDEGKLCLSFYRHYRLTVIHYTHTHLNRTEPSQTNVIHFHWQMTWSVRLVQMVNNKLRHKMTGSICLQHSPERPTETYTLFSHRNNVKVNRNSLHTHTFAKKEKHESPSGAHREMSSQCCSFDTSKDCTKLRIELDCIGEHILSSLFWLSLFASFIFVIVAVIVNNLIIWSFVRLLFWSSVRKLTLINWVSLLLLFSMNSFSFVL